VRYDLGTFQRAVRDDRTLTEHEGWAAFILASHAGTDGLNAHPGTELLAQEMKCGNSTADKALRGLRDKGIIRRTAKGNKRLGLSDVYRLIPPDGWTFIKVATQPQSEPIKVATQPPNTLLSTITDDETRDYGCVATVEAREDESTSDVPAPALSSKAIKCPHPTCKKPAPSTDTELQAHLERYHPWLLKQHEPKPVASKPAPARPPGLGAPARKPVNKWECSQCGGQFSYLGKGEPSDRMCKRCKLRIEG
jgi:hypothetical protein